jgi:NADH:ubiquinone oxidoreductase subunit 5 (subunit L)/multisubunit Na+/H+ antiporter MnhA subunit
MYYSVRLLFFVFINSFNGFKHTIKNYHKPALIEYLVLSILLFLSVLSGFIFKDSFVGLGSNYFNNSIVILPTT